MIGQTLQNYTFKNILGQGGMARVYLAENHKFNTPVAIKVLNKEFIHNDNIRKRFLSEARNLFKMSHPNIVRVTDLIEEDDTVAFVMEYIEGQTLKDYLAGKGKLSDIEITSLFSQMLDAVGYVHEQNLVHRDIKPSNFMLSNAGVVKLMDFGIAKNLDPNSAEHTVTGTYQIMGTPLYMSPEQVKSTKDVTPQSDIYSLGVVLWQMVTGEKPYGSSITSTFEIQSKIVNEPLPLTNTKWDKLIQNCTQKEKSARFKSIAEVTGKLKNNRSNNSKKEESKSETTVIEEQPPTEIPKPESTIIEEKAPIEKPPGWVSYSDSFPKNENQSKESIKRELKSEIVAEGSSNRGKIILWISILSMVIIGAVVIKNMKQNSTTPYLNQESVSQEDFNSFFSQFQSDPEFQKSRIIFPLETKSLYSVEDNIYNTVYIQKEDWSYSRLYFYWDESYAQGFDTPYIRSIDGRGDLTVIRDSGINNGYHVEYIFERIDGKWFFKKQVDASN